MYILCLYIIILSQQHMRGCSNATFMYKFCRITFKGPVHVWTSLFTYIILFSQKFINQQYKAILNLITTIFKLKV